MATYVDSVAVAGQTEFDITFPYLDASHVVVEVRGTPAPYEWVNATRIRLLTPAGAGDVVRRRRATPVSQALVEFQAGATLTETDLNTAVRQTLYIQQELLELYHDNIVRARVRLGENLGVTTSPEDLLDELVQIALADSLLDTFRSAISDIEINAESIIEQALRVDGIDSALQVVENAIEATGVSLATTNGRITDAEDRIDTLTGVVDGLVDFGDGAGIATVLAQESEARIDGDTALASLVSLIGAANGAQTAFTLNLSTVRVSPTETLGQRLTALSAATAEARALVLAEETARVTADTALTSTINALTSRVGASEAQIIDERVASVGRDNALTSSLNALTARVGTAESTIVSDRQARSNGDSALATLLDALTARVGTAEATIVTDRQARSSGDSALTTLVEALTARVGTAEATIVTDRTARVNGDNALAGETSALRTRMGTAEATLVTDRQSRVDGDTALGTRVDGVIATAAANRAFHISEVAAVASSLATEVTARQTLATQVGANASAITAEQTARSNAIAAEAASRTALAARVTSAESAIQTETSVRATETGSLATTLALLGARNGDSSAFILDMSKVQVGGGVSMGTRLSGIDSRIGTAEASVTSEISARTAADSSLSSRIDTVTSTLNGNTASITSLQSVTDGLRARAGVVLDVNGFVTGWSLNNDGASGSFSILANRFSVVDPNNGSPFTPFEISGGVVRIKNALIDNLDLVRLGSGTFNGNMAVGTGKIIFDNGTTMMVHGVGFGTANQFLEWSGPSMAINLCSEANGVRWFKTNGDAYFGGSLSIGTLTSKVATSSLAVSPEVETASFGSNGGQITVNLSYNRQITGRSATAPATGAISATVTLYRSIGGGSYATAVTLIATGTQTAEYDSELGNYLVTANISGSATYSDPSLSTSNRQLKAVVSSRGGVTSLNNGVTGTQNLSIIATEQ